MSKRGFLLTIMIMLPMLLAACGGAAVEVGVLPDLGVNSEELAAALAGNIDLTQPPEPVVFNTSSDLDIATQPAVSSLPTGDGSIIDLQNVLVDVYTLVNPSVVNIEVYLPSSRVSSGLGSGFVWDSSGHIVTNNHVIEGASRILVTFADGTTVQAEKVGTHTNSDLAVLKVNLPESALKPVAAADSDQVQVGQIAIAIGNPYGLSGTMTLGIISGLSRSLPVGLDSLNTVTGPRYSIPDIIQTDASINPGNSGGVLVNDRGELVGVTTAIRSDTGANSGIGFVIPSNIVKKVVASLIENGRFDQSWMGISGDTLTPDVASAVNLPADTQGALVIDVISGGPADKAGLVGSQGILSQADIIIAIGDQVVRRFEDIASYLYNHTQAGETIELTILRQGREMTIELTLGVIPGE